MNVNKGCYLIAEVAQAHEGSLGIAHAYIDEVADIGLNAIKFQAHFADEESTKDEKFRIPLSGQDKTRYDYWKRMEFTVEQWDGLKKHCDSRGIDFLCSPFSKYAVDLLSNIGMTRWKIGSGEVINKELLDHVRTKKCEHIYVSTGMLTSEEVNELYAYMEGYNLEWTMMHCTSMYPAPLEKLNLGRIKNYQDKYKCPIGYSDHSANINAAITSIGYGITAYEGHIVLKRTQYGPDSSSSLTVDEFKKLREFKDDYEKLKETEHKGNIDEKDININRELFSKSLCLKESQKAGTIIEETMLTLKKPGNGIRKEKIGMVVGRRLRKDWPHDRILRMDSLE